MGVGLGSGLIEKKRKTLNLSTPTLVHSLAYSSFRHVLLEITCFEDKLTKNGLKLKTEGSTN